MNHKKTIKHTELAKILESNIADTQKLQDVLVYINALRSTIEDIKKECETIHFTCMAVDEDASCSDYMKEAWRLKKETAREILSIIIKDERHEQPKKGD